MKQFLPYNALFVAAVALTGLAIFYNLVLRDTFAVTVAYTMPVAPETAAAKTVSRAESNQTVSGSERGINDYAEYESLEYVGEDVDIRVTFPLDLNVATEEELRFIPQVGSVMAQRIIQYRDVLGGYESLGQLRDIKGVGDATFDAISAYLVVGAEEEAGNNDDID